MSKPATDRPDTPKPTPHRVPPYRHVAWCYDALASAYSLGAIDRAKALHLRCLNPGDRVLYAGAGRGREVIRACERGASVTCIEPCPAMAARLMRRCAGQTASLTLEPVPIQAVEPQPVYDAVAAHFFLNLFSPATMPGVLDRLCGFVRPGGWLFIADFRPTLDGASPANRAARAAYYRPLNLAGRLLGICDLHPIYDYAPLLIERGFAIASRKGWRVLPGLPAMYETLVARQIDEPA